MDYSYDSETGRYAECSCDSNRCSSDSCPECALARLADARSALYYLQDALLEAKVRLPVDVLIELQRLSDILDSDFLLETSNGPTVSAEVFKDLREVYNV